MPPGAKGCNADSWIRPVVAMARRATTTMVWFPNRAGEPPYRSRSGSLERRATRSSETNMAWEDRSVNDEVQPEDSSFRLDTVVGMMDYSTDIMERHFAPRSDWSDMSEVEHFAQIYESDAFLLDSLRGFIGAGIAAVDTCIVVATWAHRDRLAECLRADGLDVPALVASGRYVPLDAAELLSTFMVAGLPDPDRFSQVVGAVVARAAEGRRHVRIFGEMVALLWMEGNYPAAIQLEELWNDLHKTHAFSLFCGYPMQGLEGEELARPFGEMCAEHSRVIPAESYSARSSADERLRAIALLQQRANSLEVEVAERKRAAERFRLLAESMPQKIFTARPDGEFRLLQ